MDDCIQPKYINIPIESTELIALNEAEFAEILNGFESISLKEMDRVRLMKRIDTKFLVSLKQLPAILEKAKEHYRIVMIGNQRILPYSSVYFDTEDARMYTMHHNGKLNRFKVRMRSYVSSGISFLEIKDKNNKGITHKKRIPISTEQFNAMILDEAQNHFVDTNTTYQSVHFLPQLQNFFQRITLVDKNETERVTIDLGLVYKRVCTGDTTVVDGLVIVEIKQDAAAKSYFRKYLHEYRILPGSMSKYCLGMALINPDVKNNRFKNKLRKINKITESNHGAS